MYSTAMFIGLLAALAPVWGAPAGAQEPWARPLWAVHGGGDGDAPENTLAALRRSAALGAEYAEIDLHVTKDGQVVAIHDDTIDRTTDGKGRVAELTYAQIRQYDAGSRFRPEFKGERVPLLAELLDFARAHHMKLLLHVKEPQVCPLLHDLLEKHGMVDGAQIYMRAADAAVRKALDPRVGRYEGSLVQPWGKTGAQIIQQVLDSPKVGGGLLRSYAAVVEAFPSQQARQLPVQVKGPADWSDWKKYRGRVVHPAGAIKAVDLERARENIRRYAWARSYVEKVRDGADSIAARITPEYLAGIIVRTTPGHPSGLCPACLAKKLPYNFGGNWSWSEAKPDQITCENCKTVFPNPEYPESIVLQSNWDPEQTFSFVAGDGFKFRGSTGNQRPSLSGMIRARKLSVAFGQLDTLSRAYALTGEPKYARAAKAILLRFAEVFPKYLVRSGDAHNEYADCDPHAAAEHIQDLPTDELVTPPDQPDRQLSWNYGHASRLGTSGSDGARVRQLAQAYDLTCTAQDSGTPVYSEQERIRIERDVLLEGCYLAVFQKEIHNKSVWNRGGAGLVGAVVGDPGLVRFGLEGLRKTVDGWFLPDGGTAESGQYANMTLDGIGILPLLLRDYSDPPGYVSPEGDRLDHYNPYRDTRYGDCWQALIWALQGDLSYSLFADTRPGARPDRSLVEMQAAGYPSGECTAFLQEITGKDVAPQSPAVAIFYRDPGLETRAAPPFSLPDVVFPFLSQGYLRTGATGRDSLALLNASDWGGHHHLDSLGLSYWKDGYELLSDLGYMWDHPEGQHTKRSSAHNLVLLDGKDQRTVGRGGNLHLFAITPRVKAMEASSGAYEGAPVYRRTCVQVDHGSAGSYLVDIFRAQGGVRRQYVFHGPGNDYRVQGLNLAAGAGEGATSSVLALANARSAPGGAAWQVDWRVAESYAFTAFSPGGEGEMVTIGDGWGQRQYSNSDRGATLPYIVRTAEGPGLDQFVSVFAGGPAGKPLVKSVRRLALSPGAPAGAVAIEVETTEGPDVIVSMVTPGAARAAAARGDLSTDARLAAAVSTGGDSQAACLVGGSRLALGALVLSCPAGSYGGRVLGTGGTQGESYFVLEGELPQTAALAGQTLFIESAGFRRAYPIRAARVVDGQARVYTKSDGVGFEARPGETWQFLPTAVRDARP